MVEKKVKAVIKKGKDRSLPFLVLAAWPAG
jgi:hypothetical protein